MNEKKSKTFEERLDDLMYFVGIVFIIFLVILLIFVGYILMKPCIKCLELCDGGRHVVECRFYDYDNGEFGD